MKRCLWVCFATSGLILAACGTSPTGSGRPASPSTVAAATTSTVDPGQTYLAAVGPANQALQTLQGKTQQWSDSTANSQAEADCQPAIAALQQFQKTLLAAQWPANAQQDVHSLVAAVGPLVGDLQAVATLNLLSASQWISTFDRDVAVLGAAANTVRADLDLPPAG